MSRTYIRDRSFYVERKKILDIQPLLVKKVGISVSKVDFEDKVVDDDVVNILVVEICAEDVSGLVDVSEDEKIDKKEKN